MNQQLSSMHEEQQEAMPSTNADASTDATAMTEETQQTRVDAMTASIANLFDSTLKQLIALRDSRYSAGIEELEQESKRLSEEYGQLEADIASIEAILPSKERLVQHQIDDHF